MQRKQSIRTRNSFFYKHDFGLLNNEQIKVMLYDEVFSTTEFLLHVKEVSLKTKIHEEVVKTILVNYFTNVTMVINTVRKIKTKINLYGFLKIDIKKGKRLKN